MTTTISESLAAAFARIREITETPEYQANAARLAAETKADEERQAEIRYRERLRRTGVPPEVVTMPVDDNRRAMAEVSGFLAGPPALRFLMLAGTKGQGKTFAMARGVWTEGGRYLDAQALVATGTWDPDWDDLAACRLLAVDELGAEFTNPAFEANLYALLDRRYREGKRSIIGTNLNATDFKARFCEHGLDRLLDRLGTGGKWVALSGPSMRSHWSEVTP